MNDDVNDSDGAQADPSAPSAPSDSSAMTGKERRALRARGQKMSITARIGKDGVTPGALANLAELFERHDLIKVRMQPRKPETPADWASRIEAGAECVHVVKVGFNHLFYRALKTPAS